MKSKKLLSLVLAILLCVGMLPNVVMAKDSSDAYTLTLKYAIKNWNDIEIGAGIADKEIKNIVPGTIIDLSDYWPEQLSMNGSDDETYYFGSFVENSSGDGVPIHFLKIDENKTLYAGWALDSNVSISLNTNGGALDFKAIRYPTKFANIERINKTFAPVRDGYKFQGWSLEDDGTADDAGIEITTDCTLYAVWEEVHSHCVCGGNTNIGDHTSHSEIEFTSWDKTDAMPDTAGNYVLMNNVTISSSWEPADGTVLCLNGHTLYTTCVDVKQNNQFTLCDCGNGMITASDGNSSDVIYLYAGSIFNMYGGEISVSVGQQGVTVINAAFNMYGGSIVGNYSEGDAGGGGVGNKGSFTMYNGIITGNKCGDPGSGVENHGTFIMNGGSITGNQSTQNAGGGVYNSSDATFTMNGGTITNNSSKESGGGVQNDYIFVMTGGEISGNSSKNSTGGGVWSAGTASISISGNAVITGNTGKDGTNNLHLASDGTTDAKITVGELGSNASIGVSVDSNHGMVISAGGKNYADNFFSDNGAYVVAVDGENLKLVEAEVQVGQVTLKNGEYIRNGSTEIYTDEPTGEGYAHFENGVLTLNNFTCSSDGDENAAIYTVEDLKIHVLGNNKIYSENWDGIFAVNNLEIYGGGTLTVANTTPQGMETTHVAIRAWKGSLSIKNVTLNCQGGSRGISCNTNLTLDGVTADVRTKEDDCLYGGSSVSITDSILQLQSDRTCIGSSWGDIEIANSTVEANGNLAINVNSNHNINLVSGTYKLSGTHEHGAIYVWNSTLALPEVDYWWRTSADGKFTKNDFVYDEQNYIELTTTNPHTHNYNYSVNAYTITESCTCGHSATAVIKEDFTSPAIYNKNEYKAKVVYSDNWAGNKVTELKYYKEQINDGNLVTNCIDAGDYLAVLTVEGVTAKLMFTIDQKEIGIDWAQPTNLVYDGNPKVPTASATGLVDGDSLNITVALTDSNDNVNVGSFTYTVTDIGNTNYRLSGSVTSDNYTITQATPTITNPTASRVRRGNALSTSTITAVVTDINGAEMTGNFTWKDGGTEVLNTNGTEQKIAVFTPDSTFTNYKACEFLVDVEVYSSTGGGGGTSRYTVKFETNGGSRISSKTVTRNSKLTAPDEPTQDGFTFEGWYTDKELTEKYDFDSKVTKGFTLYAKWAEIEKEPDSDSELKWNPFIDVKKDDWFYDVVKEAYLGGLIKGTSENTFSPNGNITRGMFVTILYRAEGEPAVNKSMPFADVKTDDYFANAVIWAQQNEIVKGISETEFAPNANITREQMAAILYRYAEYKGYDVSVGEDTNILSYADFDKISEYAVSSMQWACGDDIISGKGDGILDPLGTATRAEAAAVLVRFLEKI